MNIIITKQAWILQNPSGFIVRQEGIKKNQANSAKISTPYPCELQAQGCIIVLNVNSHFFPTPRINEKKFYTEFSFFRWFGHAVKCEILVFLFT